MLEYIKQWQEDAKRFNGDKMLFWAGRMSIASGLVISSSPFNLSKNIELLAEVKQIYDAEVFGRLK